MADAYDTLVSKYGNTRGAKQALRKVVPQIIKDPDTDLGTANDLANGNYLQADKWTSPNHRSQLYSNQVKNAIYDRLNAPVKKKAKTAFTFQKEDQGI